LRWETAAGSWRFGSSGKESESDRVPQAVLTGLLNTILRSSDKPPLS
jgi:hypothetical protein